MGPPTVTRGITGTGPFRNAAASRQGYRTLPARTVLGRAVWTFEETGLMTRQDA